MPRASDADAPVTTPRVLAVVVTHRGREWIRDCLVSLNIQTYRGLDVLVVDDSSPDLRDPPHLKRIVKRHLRRRRWGFVRTRRPLGFGGAINWALARVRTKADLLLFLHDDTVLDEDAVARMVYRMQADDNTAIVGPKVVSYDDPTRLEEVGMAVDRFGYPYKGLEEGEIDLGQHDKPKEVFFVTSTCMLVRHEVFRALRGWDVRMRAFSEDLDLCWRARVAGHLVRVEPRARVRHAIALGRGLRESRFTPVRYFGRRNRLRAVAKNVSAGRLVLLLPQFVLITFAEMLGFVVLREPREIANLWRALTWNFFTFPQTLAERRRVQRVRRITDRGLTRLTVRQTTRVRAYIIHETDRLEQTWGRRAELFAQRRSRARALRAKFLGWPLALVGLTMIAFLVGFRHFLWSPPSTVGSLLPFPDGGLAMWRAFLSPWHAAGLGAPSYGPPAFAFLGVLPVVAFGVAGAAQKLLVVALGILAFAGAYRMVADVADRPSRLVAGFVYALGSVGYSGMRAGALGALVFGAMAPFVLHSLLKLGGWVRPPSWRADRQIGRLAVAAAISAMFVPGSLIFYAVAATVISVARMLAGAVGHGLRGLMSSLGGVAAGLALTLPWSLTWNDSGGVLERLGGDDTWRFFAATFADHGMVSVVLGQTPQPPALFGLALPLFGVVALLTGHGQRRRMAIVLWAVIVASGWLTTLISTGLVRPFVASPIEAGVVPAAAFAALAGIAVAALRLDLRRLGLGWRHAVTVGALAGAGLLLVSGLLPSLWRGEWVPGGAGGEQQTQLSTTLRSLLAAEAEQQGPFRALWVGERWTAGAPTATRPMRHYFTTGPGGETMRDLFVREHGIGDEQLASVVASIENRSTDRGGRLLAAFNVRYVLVDPAGDVEGWLSQRDLSLARQEDDYLLLENAVALPRAGVYAELPASVELLQSGDVAEAAEPLADVQRADVARRSAARYRIRDVAGPGVVFLAESRDRRWTAHVGNERLRPIDGGWGNAFRMPADVRGTLVLAYTRAPADLVWGAVFLLAWMTAIGAVLSRRDRTKAAR